MPQEDPDVAALLDVLERLGAAPSAVDRARAESRLGALVVELAATGGAGTPFGDAVMSGGVDPAAAARYWSALGFGDVAATAPVLLPDDVRMLALLTDTAEGLLGSAATLRLARVLGQATATVSEAVVGAFRAQVEAPSRIAGAPYADTVRAYADLVAAALPSLQEAVGACVRRHVVQAAAGTWTLDEGDAQPRKDLVVGFVDLAGWTALARAVGHDELSRLVQRFEQLLADAAAAGRVRVVKLLGDGAMVVGEDADALCAFALDLVAAVAADDLLPAARVGLAAGPVLPADGDYHGAIVNLAARLVAVAAPASVLADDEVVRRAPATAFAPAQLLELRGIAAPMRASVAVSPPARPGRRPAP